jgi:ankyrin repeat protein
MDNEDKRHGKLYMLWFTCSVPVTHALIILLSDIYVSVDAKNSEGEKALHYVCGNQGVEDVKMVEFLLGRDDLDVNAKSNRMEIALHYACQKKEGEDVRMVELLLARDDLDINTRNYLGEKEFDWARRQNKDEIVKMLVAAYQAKMQHLESRRVGFPVLS